MITTILHWTCDPTSASMASLLFRWAIALAMLPYGVQKLFHPENATKFPKVLFFSPRVGYYSAAIIETFVPLFLMAGFLTRLAVIPAIVSFTIATKVTIGKDLTSPALPRAHCDIYCRLRTLLRRLLAPVHSCRSLILES